jgi:hypothetical protein
MTFAPTDYPYHRSLIPIQHFRNKNLKIEISRITNHFSSVLYIKREMRERNKKGRREKRDKRNKNRNPTISTLNGHNFL